MQKSTVFFSRIAVCLIIGCQWAALRASDCDAKPAPDYAVVAPASMKDDPEWQGVVDALAKKHNAPIITYDKNVAEARMKLAAQMPRYVGFVGRPTEAEVGRQAIIDIHKMLRTLNDDPYTDALWGVVTGYSAADAMKIVNQNEPLVVHKGAAGSGLPADVFDEMRVYSEDQAGAYQIKSPDGKFEKLKGPTDSTKALVDTFNEFKTDLFLTSGHACERNWQLGYTYKNGFFVCKNGVVYGLDTEKKLHKIDSPNPKVYLPLGNCLMGHIPDKEAMALAFMASGGVRQMCGYVVSTWFGYGAGGIREYFFHQPGRFSYAEAFYLNNQALLNRLEREYPDKAHADIEVTGIEHDPQWFGKAAMALGLKTAGEKEKQLVGLVYDRDVVAFYGDPQWDARMAPHDLPWKQTLTEKDGVFTFELTGTKVTKAERPPAAMLPRRVGKVEILEGKEFEPTVGSLFVFVPKLKEFEEGKTYKVVFKEVK